MEHEGIGAGGLLLRPIHSYCKMPRSQKANWKWSHKNYDTPRLPSDKELPRLCDTRLGNHCLYIFYKLFCNRSKRRRVKKKSESLYNFIGRWFASAIF